MERENGVRCRYIRAMNGRIMHIFIKKPLCWSDPWEHSLEDKNMTPVSERSRGLRPKHQIFVHLCGLVFRFVFFTVVALMCLFLSSIVLSYIRRERECVCVLCRRERECVCVLCRREREWESIRKKQTPICVICSTGWLWSVQAWNRTDKHY